MTAREHHDSALEEQAQGESGCDLDHFIEHFCSMIPFSLWKDF